jgi:hypothetical protein
MMEAARTSEMSVNFHEATRRNIPEGCYLFCGFVAFSVLCFNKRQ